MCGREVLGEVMRNTGMTQSELARLSGVRQPSISQILAGKIECSDDQLTRLLACMGYTLEITRRAVNADLTRSEQRSWVVHRQLATHLTSTSLTKWGATILTNIKRLRTGVRGQPHLANLDRWEHIVEDNDVHALRRALIGLDRHNIEMREVTPMGGLLPDEERRDAIRKAAIELRGNVGHIEARPIDSAG
ncbi:XRE family transcriptional regulator [Mycolicibacterium septicum]